MLIATHVPEVSGTAWWIVFGELIASIAAVLAAYLLLKLRYGSWPPRRPHR